MGYYIHFVFNPEIPITRKEIITRLGKAGATKFKSSYYKWMSINKRTGKSTVNPNLCGLYSDFLYDDLWGTITVFPRENYRFKGSWMEVRTSWGNTPDEIGSVWKAVFDLAEKVGCHVYDGQMGGYVFPEDIDRMIRYYFKITRGMTGLFGTVHNEKTNLQS